MVSVIVPVYNVEAYLCQCIDSILHQTYSDFELLLIDDGSTDESGFIADSYADPRIKTFHTKNSGLSAARNLGIRYSIGEYILFIDADDWIDPNLISTALSSIGSANILCFGYNNSHFSSALYTPQEALSALINNRLPVTVWSKLYKQDCFSSIRFPENRIYEEISTTYKLFLASSQIKCIDCCPYHYRIRAGSITNTRDLPSIIDYWLACRDWYIDCEKIICDEDQNRLLLNCAAAIARAFAWKNSITDDTPEVFSEMSSFAKEHFPLSFPLPLHIKIGIFFAKHSSKVSFWLANKFLKVYHLLHRTKTYD